ncbi:Hypothetical_protein [Hexamita inflata]|uniref:Hypothetical_protein n=1 Tax=Hexamita inflata TaxID=28002 RepID=A0AA86UAK3_9EUKA|nr:Hypothetical protein HINF_LOCUS37695 [Hexamita inflata]
MINKKPTTFSLTKYLTRNRSNINKYKQVIKIVFIELILFRNVKIYKHIQTQGSLFSSKSNYFCSFCSKLTCFCSRIFYCSCSSLQVVCRRIVYCKTILYYLFINHVD